MPLGQGIFRKPRELSKHGQIRIGLDALPEIAPVPASAHLVEHNAREGEPLLKTGQALQDSRSGPGHLGGIEGNHDGGAEIPGQCGRGAGAFHIEPVIETAVAFDESHGVPLLQGAVRQKTRGMVSKKRKEPVPGKKEGIKVGGRPPGRC